MASDVLRFSFNADAKYTERKNIAETTLSSIAPSATASTTDYGFVTSVGYSL